MNTWGVLVFVAVLYIAYQIGRFKGRAEMFYQKNENQKKKMENIEKADFEEIK